MTRVDDIFKENIAQIISSGCWDENPRAKYADGSDANALFITDVYEKYEVNEIPLTTLRPIPVKSALRELQWMFQMQSNDLKELNALGVHYWNDWNIGDGTIGMRYGGTIKKHDLMNKLLKGLEENPFGRRHIMNLWQEDDFKEETKGLMPCTFLSEWVVRKENNVTYLDAMLIQRSSDYLVSGHIDMFQYKALQMMIAKHLGIQPGTFSRHTANLHIYNRHLFNAGKMYAREASTEEPTLVLNVPDGTDFYSIDVNEFELSNYDPNKEQLKFELAI